MVKSTAFFVALPLLATTLVAGCSEATWSDEPSQSYVGTVTISKQLDAGFTDLAWERKVSPGSRWNGTGTKSR